MAAVWSPAAAGPHSRPAYALWRAGGRPQIIAPPAVEGAGIRAVQPAGGRSAPSGPAAAAAAAAAAPGGLTSSKCYLVGAGPGPADLLTVRAAELLRRADAVIYDDLGAAAAVEAYAPPGCERLYVGKRGGRPSVKQPEIDALLVATAAAAPGRTVVRLKGGCPSVFSRVRGGRGALWLVCCRGLGAGARWQTRRYLLAFVLQSTGAPHCSAPTQVHSEVAALQAAGIHYEVVPGVSSALAAPLAAGARRLAPLALPPCCCGATAAWALLAVALLPALQTVWPSCSLPPLPPGMQVSR